VYMPGTTRLVAISADLHHSILSELHDGLQPGRVTQHTMLVLQLPQWWHYSYSKQLLFC
jgi:hypothetical protein